LQFIGKIFAVNGECLCLMHLFSGIPKFRTIKFGAKKVK